MHKIIFKGFFVTFFFSAFLGIAQEKILYKQIDTTKLYMEVHYPEKMEKHKKYPAVVFFFGGGWFSGSLKQFEAQAIYLSKRGMVCFLADYRVSSRQQTSPFEALKDAKSAMRFVRANAEKFHIDANKIVASGGSAGGHLAAATALIEDYNEQTDNITISPKPNALVLFNPVIDNGPGGYGFERIGAAYKQFSPLHNIQKGAPPTIIFLGTKDKLIPVETAKYFEKVMQLVGSKCELFLYEGQEHAFFNYKKFEYYKKTLTEFDRFLISLGYLTENPKIVIE